MIRERTHEDWVAEHAVDGWTDTTCNAYRSRERLIEVGGRPLRETEGFDLNGDRVIDYRLDRDCATGGDRLYIEVKERGRRVRYVVSRFYQDAVNPSTLVGWPVRWADNEFVKNRRGLQVIDVSQVLRVFRVEA